MLSAQDQFNEISKDLTLDDCMELDNDFGFAQNMRDLTEDVYSFCARVEAEHKAELEEG